MNILLKGLILRKSSSGGTKSVVLYGSEGNVSNVVLICKSQSENFESTVSGLCSR